MGGAETIRLLLMEMDLEEMAAELRGGKLGIPPGSVELELHVV